MAGGDWRSGNNFWRWLTTGLFGGGSKYREGDYLGNYSREYIWDANQFGHMSLGLFGVLLYFWATDAISRLFLLLGGVLFDFEALSRALAADPTRAAYALANWSITLLTVAILVVLALIAAAKAARRAVRPSGELRDAAARRATTRLAEALAQAAAAFVLFAIFATVAYFVWRAGAARLQSHYLALANGASVLLVTAFLALIAVLISERRDLTLLAWIALTAAALMRFPQAVEELGDLRAPLWGWRIDGEAALMFLVAAFAIIAAVIAIRRPFGAGAAQGGGWGWALAFLMFLGGALLHQTIGPPAVAAAVASLAMWYLKEFGGDLPEVARRLEATRAARQAAGFPAVQRGVTRAADVARLEAELMRDAAADCRSDGVFYVVGAMIGVAVLVFTALELRAAQDFVDGRAALRVFGGALPLPEDGPSSIAWRALPATAAVLAFFVVFLWVKRRWGPRADALDRVDIAAAQRLAVFDAALATRLHLNGADRDAAAPAMGELSRLRAFCAGDLAVESAPVRHLIIAGPPGGGRSDLAFSIASEAALEALPVWGAAEPLPKRPRWRVHYHPLARLFARFSPSARAEDRRAAEREFRDYAGEDGAPLADFYVFDSADPIALDALEAGLALAGPTPDLVAARRARAAHEELKLSAGHRAARRALIDAALDRLRLSGEDQTVWALTALTPTPERVFADRAADPSRPSESDWAPATPATVAAFHEDLEVCLRRRLGAEAVIGVAVALTARRPS